MATDQDTPLLNTGADPRVVLIAVDASSGASKVISAGARLCRSLPHAVIHVAHVFRTNRFDRSRAGTSAPASEALEDAKEYLEFHVKSAKKQCRNEIRGHFLVGEPVSEILKLASEIKTDLLVVGTHDYAGFERLLLGSIAETLMRKAGCSVLVVRPPPHRDE